MTDPDPYRIRFYSYDPKTHEVTPIVPDPDDENAALFQWAREFEDRERNRIMRTQTPAGLVSTIFLGVDHSYGLGERQLFETALLRQKTGASEVLDRYASYDDALAAHFEYVAKYQKVKA